jgi:hypothetical protein
MKTAVKTVLGLFIMITILSCTPKIIKNGDKQYDFVEWDGGELQYAEFIWNGGNTKKATELMQAIETLRDSRGLDEEIVGRFPDGKTLAARTGNQGPA